MEDIQDDMRWYLDWSENGPDAEPGQWPNQIERDDVHRSCWLMWLDCGQVSGQRRGQQRGQQRCNLATDES